MNEPVNTSENLDSLQYSFTAGQTHVYRGGNYISIASLVDEIEIEFFKKGSSLGKVGNIGAGFYANISKFDLIKITSATAQTVNVIVGTGEFGVNKTSTVITGGLLDYPVLGDGFYLSSALAGLTTVVPPASNTKGIIVYFCGINISGSAKGRFMFKETAPTSIDDPDAQTLGVVVTSGTAPYGNDFSGVNGELIVPPGKGIYFQKDTAIQSTCFIEFDIKV